MSCNNNQSEIKHSISIDLNCEKLDSRRKQANYTFCRTYYNSIFIKYKANNLLEDHMTTK